MSTKIDPEILVERSVSRKLDICDKVECPMCFNRMEWRWSMIKAGSISQGLLDHRNKDRVYQGESMLKGVFPTHDDQTWKCPTCFFVCTFGIPMTKEEYDQELIDRGGQVLMPDLFVANLDMYKRLKALGYLD